jgi:hypothetical protein
VLRHDNVVENRGRHGRLFEGLDGGLRCRERATEAAHFSIHSKGRWGRFLFLLGFRLRFWLRLLFWFGFWLGLRLRFGFWLGLWLGLRLRLQFRLWFRFWLGLRLRFRFWLGLRLRIWLRIGGWRPGW